MGATHLGIAICYRREDTAETVEQLEAFLRDFPPSRTTEIDWVELVDENVSKRLETIAASDVVLVVIGARWLALTDHLGRRRIDDPLDPIRTAIEVAFDVGVRVIPVLADGATHPRAGELPRSLAQLAELSAVSLDGADFRTDGLLVSALSELDLDELPSDDPNPALAAVDDGPPLYVDENVQFTVYRPRTIEMGRWSTLLAFAHLAERRPDADPNEPDPLDEVRRQAEQLLGEDFNAFADLTQDSSSGVPHEGEITFLPDAPGVEFNPTSRTFRWLESVHREEFRLRATSANVGETIRGRMSVFLGVRLLADVSLQFRVVEASPDSDRAPDPVVEHAAPYRKIFASYSHRDVTIAEQLQHFAETFGDRYTRDWVDLRAGEKWSERLEELISEADIFQLLWSTNSMRSENVRREWEYALSLGREFFVRPTYWEDPMPHDRTLGLPPAELLSLHFQRFAVEAVVPAAAPVIVPRLEAPAPDAVAYEAAREAATSPSWRQEEAWRERLEHQYRRRSIGPSCVLALVFLALIAVAGYVVVSAVLALLQNLG